MRLHPGSPPPVSSLDPSARDVPFRHLLEALPAGAYTCDRDGLITYYNAAAVRLWGRAPKLNDPADRFCGSFRLFAADGTPISHDQCWMALALRTGDEYTAREIWVERPDGQRLAVLAHASPVRDAHGRLVGAVNVLVDISDRKRVEEDLRRVAAERDAQLADLARLHEVSIRLTSARELPDVLDGTLRAATAIAGTGMGVLSLCDPDLVHLTTGASLGLDADFLASIDRVPPGGGACGTAFRERRRVVVEDVEADPLFAPYREAARRAGFRAVHSTPLLTRAGRIIGVLSTHFARPHRPGERETYLTDLLARQAADLIENARLYQALREQDRRKDEFLAVLAHELRNPLAPIRNATQLLRTTPLDAAGRTARDVIDRQARHLARLVDDLIDLSRITSGKLQLRTERVELGDVLRAAVETSRPLIDQAGLAFDVRPPAEPVHLIGDPTRLAQVVSNLLNNAAKFTDRGGRVCLTAERQGSDAVLTVRDTGVGIPAGQLSRIFEMFAQADRGADRGGLGIGLTLVKRLVEMHGGSVAARSNGPGHGSEFVVRLPVLLDAGPGAGRTNGTGVRAMSSLRILVADDNRDAADSLTMLLQVLGNEVRTAYDGEAAVTVAAEARPDVALLDIGMPRLNGYEAARKIRDHAADRAPVLIATTGWCQETDRRRSEEAGFDHHLVKPIDPTALIQLLATLERNRARRVPV